MSELDNQNVEQTRRRQRALSRWDNEGGATPSGPQTSAVSGELGSGDVRHEVPDLTGREVIQLRIRVIALENLMIALLAEAPQRQCELARAMAGYILPKPGSTPHPLTIRAASLMVDLVERADHFRNVPADN